ncbi:type VII secretion protein EccCb [Mycobacterium asiaticum]|uniref:Type VII secretion protein EccCb n=1 Tax=Mycobacterium asiaticum TaxID=1790 RepID=A0A1A3CZ19_MYCAS|nr:type VII secretion protein EccCb [Mycobacterium asiaticum]OBI91346.1 type VII secretion protein EccCb [Mycobacterium asiaticum]
MTAVIEIAAPPEVPQTGPSRLAVLLPVVMSAVAMAVAAGALVAGSPAARNPSYVLLPVMMSASAVVTAIAGQGRRRGAAIDAVRDEYLAYLSEMSVQVSEVAGAQYMSLIREFPDPDCLWTLSGHPQQWARPVSDSEGLRVRVGVARQPLGTRLVAARLPPERRCDPVTVAAMQRFLELHSTIEAPTVLRLRPGHAVTVDGDAAQVRGLLRAIICRLACRYAPEDMSIVGVGAGWDWLKWLPHNRHPRLTDALGPARMVYRSVAQARDALSAGAALVVVMILDVPDAEPVPGAISLVVGRHATSIVVRHADGQQTLTCPDRLSELEAAVCARRLLARTGTAPPAGAGLFHGFDNPIVLWRNQHRRDRLSAPIGSAADGQTVNLDIKEAAEQGMGPHGLCVGATGSGKSELLRTIALGMIARNSPAVLNLLLVDFKGGAAFLDFVRASHVAAVITNLADEAPLVARMRESLAGEINRRQRLLRAAGCASLTACAQRRGTDSDSLPTLFIIVDEFSELLSQHPDFADTFVAIGRLGRSLGMHLLLASQRLEEGRLRGLEAHLSYRLCLKTLSESESRAVLGTTDAYHLPNTPGAGFLRTAGGELVRFQSALVSQPGAPTRPTGTTPGVPQRFTADPAGDVTEAIPVPAPSVLDGVLARVKDHGPPAHPVWLPPLSTAPTLGPLLRDGEPADLAVPIGVVDRPYEQSRTPLTVELSGAAGNVAVVGAPRAGKSTALRTVLTALAATHAPARLQFYCLDFGGGALFALADLPHVGAVAGRSQPGLVARVVGELESILRTRECSGRDGRGADSADVMLVVDGWAALRQQFDGLEESITMIAAQGLSYGVHVVLSASRWAEIRPALKDQIGTRIELRLGDPADSELDRRRAREVPRDHPGRGLSPEGLHMMMALPDLEDVEIRCDGSAAPPIPQLPAQVNHGSILAGADRRMLLGLGETRLQPVFVDLDNGRHLLILGDNGCGKTATLRVLCREITRAKTAAQAQLFLVDYRRTLIGVVESGHLGGYAMSPAALTTMLPDLIGLLRDRMPTADVDHAQLRTRSWWTGPDVYVVIDDYDLVAASTGNPLLLLLEYLPYATDLGLHLVVARRSGGAARALYEPLIAGLRDLGCMGLMMSGRAEDGVLLTAQPVGPLPPGRGVLITRPGVEQVIQVGWAAPA